MVTGSKTSLCQISFIYLLFKAFCGGLGFPWVSMMDGIHSPCVPKTARPNHSFYVVLMNAWNILNFEIGVLQLG